MPDEAPKTIVVRENAGTIDALTATGRYLIVIIGAVPALLSLLGARDFAGLVDYFQGADGTTLIAALSAVAAAVYGVIKSRKRGSQIAAVAVNDRVPNSIVTTK